ncbi:MAG: MaoC family dehydratase [Acidobacteriota bacterium]
MDLTIEQIIAAQDLELGTSDWLAIDQARIDAFADATGDHQWIHVDPVRAAEAPGGRTIAHGYLVLSLIPQWVFDLVTLPDAGMVINYGLDRMRCVAPVPCGAAVRLRATLIGGQPRGGGVLMRLRAEVEVRDGDEAARPRRALVTELLFLVQPAS